MKKYTTVIGLEVHAELKTNSKAFCSCSTEFGGEPNTHVCPVCLGMPGALPVLNKQVVEFAIRAGLALNCDIQTVKTIFIPICQKTIRSLNSISLFAWAAISTLKWKAGKNVSA